MVTPDQLNQICARLDALARNLRTGKESQVCASRKLAAIAKEIRDSENPDLANVISLEGRVTLNHP